MPSWRCSDTANYLAEEWRESSLKWSYQDVQQVSATLTISGISANYVCCFLKNLRWFIIYLAVHVKSNNPTLLKLPSLIHWSCVFHSKLVINQITPEDDAIYQCQAENEQGSVLSMARLIVVMSEDRPSAPRNIQADTVSSSAILLAWERPLYNSDKVIAYSVHYMKAEGKFSKDTAAQECSHQEVCNPLTFGWTHKEIQFSGKMSTGKVWCVKFGQIWKYEID